MKLGPGRVESVDRRSPSPFKGARVGSALRRTLPIVAGFQKGWQRRIMDYTGRVRELVCQWTLLHANRVRMTVFPSGAGCCVVTPHRLASLFHTMARPAPTCERALQRHHGMVWYGMPSDRALGLGVAALGSEKCSGYAGKHGMRACTIESAIDQSCPRGAALEMRFAMRSGEEEGRRPGA